MLRTRPVTLAGLELNKQSGGLPNEGNFKVFHFKALKCGSSGPCFSGMEKPFHVSFFMAHFKKPLSVAGFINTFAYPRLLHCNRQNIQKSAQIILS